MAKYVTRPINTVPAVATGVQGPVTIEDMETASVQITGITVATVQVQISLDGTAFFNHGAALTANGLVASIPRCKAVRYDVTAWTSGNILGAVGGEDADRLG